MRGRVTQLVAPLRRPRLRRLAGAFLVNEFGDGIAVVVLPLLVYATTGSGMLTGVTFAGVRAAGVVGRPVGGLLADRLDRMTVLRTTFVVRGGLLTLGLAARTHGALAVCLLLTAFVGTIDNPAGEAAIREGATGQAQQVATIRKVSRALSGVVGLSVGGLLVGAAGSEVAVAVDVGTYLVALVLLPPSPQPAVADAGTGRPHAGWAVAVRRAVAASLADGREGVRHLRDHTDLRVVAGMTGLSAGVVTALLTVAVVWLDQLPGAPPGAYGIALAGYSTGAILGLVAAGLIAWQVSVPTLGTRTLLIAGVACAAGAVGSDWRVLAASWVAWGIAWGPFDVWGDARVQELTPDQLLGRVYGGIGTLAALAQVIGGVAAGLLADVTDPRVLVVSLGAIFLVAASWTAGHRSDNAGSGNVR